MYIVTKKKISRFEFAIMESINPEQAKQHERYTEKGEFEQRQLEIERQMKRLKTK